MLLRPILFIKSLFIVSPSTGITIINYHLIITKIIELKITKKCTFAQKYAAAIPTGHSCLDYSLHSERYFKKLQKLICVAENL